MANSPEPRRSRRRSSASGRGRYWLTGAIGSTFWSYCARLHEPWIVPDGASVMVPTAYAEYPQEILTPPRSLAEPFYGNIQRWTRMAEGGRLC